VATAAVAFKASSPLPYVLMVTIPSPQTSSNLLLPLLLLLLSAHCRPVPATGCRGMLSSADARSVGSEAAVALGDDPKLPTHTLRTESLSPAVFSVDNFVSQAEMAEIRRLFDGWAAGQNNDPAEVAQRGDGERENFHAFTWPACDLDQSGSVLIAEFLQCLGQHWNLPGLTRNELPMIMQSLGLCTHDDGAPPDDTVVADQSTLTNVDAALQMRVRQQVLHQWPEVSKHEHYNASAQPR
jgi:hypothetical protein